MHLKGWGDFQKTGLLWWINRILHTFGWSIVLEEAEDGTILNAYPARTKWRGFSEKTEEEGYRKIAEYMALNADQLREETK